LRGCGLVYGGGDDKLGSVSEVTLKWVTRDGKTQKGGSGDRDSNGAAADGWPVWLRQVVAADVFINNSQSGRTLGFDNPDERSNGLANITRYMDEAVTQAGEGVDDVVAMLGTNDCKACFDKRLGEVEGNLRKMIELIRKHDNGGKWSPRVLVVSPPPYGRDEDMLEKYKEGRPG